MADLKVALFCTDFLSFSQTFIYDEIRAHQRYSVDVFAERRLNAPRFPVPNVHALVEGLDPSSVSRAPLRASTQLARLALYRSAGRSRRFDRVFRKNKFDLVHAHFGRAGVRAIPFAERHDLPLVVTFHGPGIALLQAPQTRLRVRLPDFLTGRGLLERMTLGLCASSEIRELLVLAGASPRKLAVHRLGIDLARFSTGERDPNCVEILMIGRFVEKKGFRYGLQAFAKQLEEGACAHLYLIGDGELRRNLQMLIRKLGIEQHVTLTGVLSSDQIAERLRRSHILVAPSVVASDGDREAGLIVVKEASACEAVPIGTYHGGIPEIIVDGKTGFLVPERNVDALSERLGSLLRDPELRGRLGRAGRRKMEREYDLEKRVEALEDLYDKARARYQRP